MRMLSVLFAIELLLESLCTHIVEAKHLVVLQRDANLLLASAACAGLANRVGPSVYLVGANEADKFWESQLLAVEEEEGRVMDEVFIRRCLQNRSALLFQTLEPSVVTIAAMEGHIPLTKDLADRFHAKIAKDVREKSVQELEALARSVLHKSSGLAFQRAESLSKGYLVDFIFKQSLFTVYLENGCIPHTRDHAQLQEILLSSPWEKPVPVYGYNHQWKLFGGDVFEAETNCFNYLGQIASEHASNLAFWSARKHVGAPLQQSPASRIDFDEDTTYIALVYGDMDNIDYVQKLAYRHMLSRVDRCKHDAASCFPLTWTLSPHLLKIAPEILEWYFSRAKTTSMDWFIFPPSGTLYSYPGAFPQHVKQAYVQDMDYAAEMMDTRGSIHWEWFYAWNKAFQEYFGLFRDDHDWDNSAKETDKAKQHQVKGFFLNNVPWVLPLFNMWGQTYRWFGDVVVFRALFNWALGGTEGGVGGKSYSPSKVARKLSSLSRGTVAYFYTIQTTEPDHLFEMAQQLPPHVKLVSYEQLMDLARQKDERERNKSPMHQQRFWEPTDVFLMPV